ncbi:hypothetical protein J7E83_02470 [Arthrobacter sp. ISL-48]|uniref:hypothetical protein n=1 Tax=Arthrobacter sp. ISL-48 TaxID=2819110 RepID=UPI001BE6B2E2|nr:hypothetical protein [Arthrobacter sp. ISL-48]MBT2531003.1 hypothetical protein [Arthrobacter sp. ISL-48]
MTEHESSNQPEPEAGNAPEARAQADNPESNGKPASNGVKSRLTEAQRAMLASKSRGGDAGLTSVGKSHKPTHASGKQGPAEKKVRW